MLAECLWGYIGLDGKVSASQGDYKRNEIAAKRLKDKYELTYAADKSKTDVKKLHPAERVKYEIYNAGSSIFRHAFDL